MKKEFSDIYIYGAGESGLEVYNELAKHNLSTTGFIDKFKIGELCGLAIVSPDEVDDCECIIISIQDAYICAEVFCEIREKSNKIFWYISGLKGSDFFKDKCVEADKWTENLIPRLDIHLADSCNLNCVGCTHFSPLFTEVGCQCESVLSDIKKAVAVFGSIISLNLLGGEPLLNDDLINIIYEVRATLPYSSIMLFTNGLLLPQMHKEFWEAIKKNKIKLYVSQYTPTQNVINKIIEVAKRYEVCLFLSGYDRKQKFNKPLSIRTDDEMERICISNGCVSVAEGKISRCPTLLYINRLNEEFGCAFPDEGIYSLDEYYGAGNELILRLKEPIPLCDYCVKNEIEWKICNKTRELSDFVEV